MHGSAIGAIQPLGQPGKAHGPAMTREPGDLPASGRSCPVQGMVEARSVPTSDAISGGGAWVALWNAENGVPHARHPAVRQRSEDLGLFATRRYELDNDIS